MISENPVNGTVPLMRLGRWNTTLGAVLREMSRTCAFFSGQRALEIGSRDI